MTENTIQVLTELHERLLAKATMLKTASDTAGDNANLDEMFRLSGKAEGVALAASFLLEIIDGRVGIPLDEITETPARTGDPRTSHMAIKTLKSSTSRGAVALAFYKSRFGYGEDGLTPVGAFSRAGIKNHKSPWKRVSDLKGAGIIAPTGELVQGDRGRMVEVLAITDFGAAEVERLMPEDAAAVKANALVRT